MHIKDCTFNDFFCQPCTWTSIFNTEKKRHKDTKTPRVKTQIECQQPNRETYMYQQIHAHTPPASSRKTNRDIYRVCRQTNRQTDKQTDGRTDGQTDRQTDRQTDSCFKRLNYHSNIFNPKFTVRMNFLFLPKKVPKAGHFVGGMCCLALLLHFTINCKIKWQTQVNNNLIQWDPQEGDPPWTSHHPLSAGRNNTSKQITVSITWCRPCSLIWFTFFKPLSQTP